MLSVLSRQNPIIKPTINLLAGDFPPNADGVGKASQHIPLEVLIRWPALAGTTVKLRRCRPLTVMIGKQRQGQISRAAATIAPLKPIRVVLDVMQGLTVNQDDRLPIGRAIATVYLSHSFLPPSRSSLILLG